MSQLNLASAIQAYKRSANKRNVRLFEKEVDKTILKQIKLKKEEIKELREQLKEGLEEKRTDLQETLVRVNEEDMATTSDRKQSAEDYLQTGIDLLLEIETWEESTKEAITTLEVEITLLEKLYTTLTELQIQTEEE